MQSYRRWVDPILREEYRKASEGSHQRLHASLGLLSVDPGQVEYLTGQALIAGPSELPVIWRILKESHRAPVKTLWDILENPQADPDQRFRAACVLASEEQSGSTSTWNTVSQFVADRLLTSVIKNPSHYEPLVEMSPIRNLLLPPLATIFRDKNRPDSQSQRLLATSILADFAGDQPAFLADLLMDATDDQFIRLMPKARAGGQAVVALLESELAKKTTSPRDDEPLRPSWTTPDPALAAKIEMAQGMLTERFAFCQTMALDEFLSVAEGLRTTGFRPIRLRPYSKGHAVRVAAVWTRDGLDWQISSGLTAEEIRKRNAEFRHRKLIPADVAGYVTTVAESGSVVRYAATWVSPSTPADESHDRVSDV